MKINPYRLFKNVPRISLLCCILFSLVSCNKEDQQKALFSFPLLQECKNVVVSEFNKTKDELGYEFDFQLEEFSLPLDSHPSIIGVVRLSSSSVDKEKLGVIANGPLLSCYPLNSRKYDVGKGKTLSELTDDIYLLKEVERINRFFPVINEKDNSMEIYFHRDIK